MKLLTVDTLDEIFRFTKNPSFVLYFKKLMSRQTMRLLYKGMSIDEEAITGNLQTIMYLHLVGAKCTTDAMNYASMNGHLEVVKYLHETVGAECSIYAMGWASQSGYLEVVKYLHETVGVKITIHGMLHTCKNGFLDIVKYLHKTVGVKFTEDEINWESKNGFLDVVKYLKEIT